MSVSLVAYTVFQRTAATPEVRPSASTIADERETTYFRENIVNVESPEDLLADFRLYKYALRAFNMDDQLNSRAIVKKALDEGVADDESFANRWTDGRYLEMARAFGFAEVGTENVTTEGFADFMAEQYSTVSREVRAGEENEAVRLAAYFKRNAADFTNWYQPLANQPLREVVMTALQVPQAIQTQPDLEKLIDHLEGKFDVADFRDPEKLDALIERFLILNDLQNGVQGASAASSTALTILSDAGLGTGGLLGASSAGGTGGGSIINLTL